MERVVGQEGVHWEAAGTAVCFGGGMPLLHDGRVIGGIGFSGGSELEDEACVRAGLVAIGLDT